MDVRLRRPDWMIVGPDELMALRKAIGLTQPEFAALICVADGTGKASRTVGRWEASGGHGPPGEIGCLAGAIFKLEPLRKLLKLDLDLSEATPARIAEYLQRHGWEPGAHFKNIQINYACPNNEIMAPLRADVENYTALVIEMLDNLSIHEGRSSLSIYAEIVARKRARRSTSGRTILSAFGQSMTQGVFR